MILESTNLSLSHVGLGNLNEFAAMVLFSNAHANQLTAGLDIQPTQIKDAQGRTLYPAYYRTHLQVPPTALLNSFKLWEPIQIGVEVQRFGQSMLESTYLLGKAGHIPEDPSLWDTLELPKLSASNLFVIDVSDNRSPVPSLAAPKPDNIAKLKKIVVPPAAANRATEIRTEGWQQADFFGSLHNEEPILYEIVPNRDVAPGHAVMFAKFAEFMDYAEFRFLAKQLRPGLQIEVLSHLQVLEREIFYYSNCFAGDTIEIYLKADLEECPPDYHGTSRETISLGLLNTHFELYLQRNNALLTMGRVKKLIALPTSSREFSANIAEDVKRIIRQSL